jgi:hypothetical protein
MVHSNFLKLFCEIVQLLEKIGNYHTCICFPGITRCDWIIITYQQEVKIWNRLKIYPEGLQWQTTEAAGESRVTIIL